MRNESSIFATDDKPKGEPKLGLSRVATEEDEVQGGRLVKQIYGTSLKFIDYPYILK